MALVNYKSSTTPPPEVTPPPTPDVTTHYRLRIPEGYETPRAMVSGFVPKAEAAELAPIGEDLNAGMSEGGKYILGVGGGVVLDRMRIKNVIFQNVDIFYAGTPVSM